MKMNILIKLSELSTKQIQIFKIPSFSQKLSKWFETFINFVFHSL